MQKVGGTVPKKKKKQKLSARAHQKLIDEQNTKDAEAQEKAQMVVQVSQLAQLPNANDLNTSLVPKSERSWTILTRNTVLNFWHNPVKYY